MPAPTSPASRQLEALDVEACMDLLRRAHVGRIAFVLDGQPQVVPVNHCFHEGAVVFRTTYGTLLDNVDLAAVVFEVDDLEPEAHTGWSVIVRGRAEEVWEPEDLERMRALPLRPWAPGARDHYVRILPAAISGRRII